MPAEIAHVNAASMGFEQVILNAKMTFGSWHKDHLKRLIVYKGN